MRAKSILASSLCLIMILTLTACKQPSSQLEEIKEVAAIEVKQEKEIEVSESSGTLQVVEETTSSFEIPGRIKSIKVAEGTKVNLGDVLAELDSEDYQLQVNMADSNLKRAAAALDLISMGAREQEIVISKSKLDQATAVYQKALTDSKRWEELYKSGGIALTEYESIKTQLTIAEKDMTSAQQAYSMTTEGARKEDRDQVSAGYAAAVASKDQATLALSKTQLKSAISGTVIAKYITASQLINVGTPVFKIGNIESLKVVLSVPDYEISNWQIGDKVTATLYGNSKEGIVTKKSPSINEGTATIGVEVTIDNQQNDWLPGQVITCSHAIDGKDAIYIPVASVVKTGNENPYIFIVDNDTAVKRFVTLGKIQNDKLEISSGLEPGDKVVIKGAERLFDNDKIKIVGG
ncbi:efflux RND transporter periplasmic adaptor subunit [Desulfosporosinus fructosivorans]